MPLFVRMDTSKNSFAFLTGSFPTCHANALHLLYLCFSFLFVAPLFFLNLLCESDLNVFQSNLSFGQCFGRLENANAILQTTHTQKSTYFIFQRNCTSSQESETKTMPWLSGKQSNCPAVEALPGHI